MSKSFHKTLLCVSCVDVGMEGSKMRLLQLPIPGDSCHNSTPSFHENTDDVLDVHKTFKEVRKESRCGEL